jgi:hypothetical protein
MNTTNDDMPGAQASRGMNREVDGGMETVYPGVWKVRIGRPEARTPMTLLPRAPRREALEAMRPVEACPIGVDQLHMMIRPRGMRVEIAPAPRPMPEQFYGLGLQLGR